MKKVKRIVLILIALVLLAVLFGCGRSGSDDQAAEDEAVTTEDYNEAAEAAEAESAETANSGTEESEESSDDGLSVISPEFKKTMDDYEAWFDHYCEVMKKYQENPSDLGLLSEMTELLSEETTMLEQLENMDESEMNSAELAYYLEVTARIQKKLLEVADY